MTEQLTLLDTFPQNEIRGDYTPSFNTHPLGLSEPVPQKLERQKSQKERILEELQGSDLVSVNLLKEMAAQYNARINELNKELALQDPPEHIVTVYHEGEYYKRLEVVQDESRNRDQKDNC